MREVLCECVYDYGCESPVCDILDSDSVIKLEDFIRYNYMYSSWNEKGIYIYIYIYIYMYI